MFRRARILALGLASTIAFVVMVQAHDELDGKPHHIDAPMNPTAVMKAFMEGKLGDTLAAEELTAAATTLCTDGTAGIYPCDNVDLNAFLPLNQIGGTVAGDEANDIWGWTDPENGDEYAIIGRIFGTSFVNVKDPSNPVYLGYLPVHGRFGSPWRDIKVFKNHAFVVSEARRHGMQVFDLTRLRGLDGTSPETFSEDAHYGGFGSAHNIVINEESGFAYGVGTNKCSGGLEMVNIQDPLNPTDAGCYAGDGYTHDAQCVIYRGLDETYVGQEICFASNEDSLTIINVTNKNSPVLIAKSGYPDSEYTHQGWLNEDHSIFFFDDELDEWRNGVPTTTRAWDISELSSQHLADTPPDVITFDNDSNSIDHNLYIKGRFMYQANYRSGLRVIEIDPSGNHIEAGFFDIYPADDDPQFNGAWSNYPYFASGTVVISGIEQGLFMVTPDVDRVAFDGPWHGSVLTDEVPLNISAYDSDTAIDISLATVTLELDGELLNVQPPSPVGSGNVSVSWNSNGATDGQHRLTARMVSGGAATSNTILVTVNNGGSTENLAPNVAITSPTGGKVSGMVTIAGTAADADGTVESVDIFHTFDGAEVPLGTATLNETNWAYDWDTTGEPDGTHTIRAEATDDEGAKSSDSVNVKIGGGGGGGNCPPKKPGCS